MRITLRQLPFLVWIAGACGGGMQRGSTPAATPPGGPVDLAGHWRMELHIRRRAGLPAEEHPLASRDTLELELMPIADTNTAYCSAVAVYGDLSDMLREPPSFRFPEWCRTTRDSISFEMGLGVDDGGLRFRGRIRSRRRIEGVWWQEWFSTGDAGDAVLVREVPDSASIPR